MSNTKERARTITWEAPHIPGQDGQSRSGLEHLQQMIAGKVPRPPMAAMMNFSLAEVSEGRAVFCAEPEECHYNPIGAVHGGFAAALLDSAMGCAVHSTLPAGVRYTTLEIKVNFVQAMTVETGRVRCEAKVLHAGNRTATAEASIVDEGGNRYAHGTTTCIIFR
jgi:uncharacterized protein (TIGR00369 family)